MNLGSSTPKVNTVTPLRDSHPDLIELSDPAPKILYCRCAFAQVVPDAVKDQVLEQLLESGASFESVADLCEMSARNDPRLGELIAGEGAVRIAACFPRAVKWMFHHAGYPFPDDDRVEVLNMRELSAEEVVKGLLAPAPPEKVNE